MFPDDYVAIDETLYPTRGGILFKTYGKDKPAKYGLNCLSCLLVTPTLPVSSPLLPITLTLDYKQCTEMLVFSIFQWE